MEALYHAASYIVVHYHNDSGCTMTHLCKYLQYYRERETVRERERERERDRERKMIEWYLVTVSASILQ